jgi:predicted AAA+ superfamily ATPase
MLKKRYLHSFIASDLADKMVFIGGPRQVGKTTLANQIGKIDFKKYSYLNWDSRQDRKKIISGMYDADAKLLIFDEIHKYKQWKNYLKGEYDKQKEKFTILATGSARMDVYRRGGDSLMGRYHYFRLHPFSLREAFTEKKPAIKIMGNLFFPEPKKGTSRLFSDLFRFGGFPEPFVKKDEKTLRRFHNERIERLIKEDIRDLEQLRDLSALQVLVEILPEKVGSLFSLNSLKEDLGATHKTISLWMDILERFYYHFRIYPFSARSIRSLRKEPKLYLWDWSLLSDEGAKFENLIASHLLKLVHFLYDTEGYKAELFFLRDTDGREIDFLVTIDKKPWFSVEAKLSKNRTSKSSEYFFRKLNIPFSFRVVNESGVDFWQKNTRVISAEKFLSGLV